MINPAYVGGLEIHIMELAVERNELKAQVEVLREVAQPIIDHYFNWMEVNEVDVTELTPDFQNVYYMMVNLKVKLRSTPAQCLAEIKAQAVADAVNAHPEKIAYIEHYGQTRSRGDYCDLWLSSSDLIQYANQLRQSAKDK